MENVKTNSLIELKTNLRSLISSRKKLDTVAKKDPTFTEENRTKTLEESKSLIDNAKKELTIATNEVKERIISLKEEKRKIKLQNKEKIESLKNQTFEVSEDLEAKKNSLISTINALKDEHKKQVDELKNKFLDFQNKTKTEIKELKENYKEVRTSKTISFKERDEKLIQIKGLVYDKDHTLAREKNNFEVEISKLNDTYKEKLKGYKTDLKWLGKDKEKAIHDQKVQNKKEIRQINAKLDDERDNLKANNYFGYKFLVNRKLNFLKFINKQKETFTHLDLFKEWLIRNILFIIIILFVIVVAIISGGNFISWSSIVNIITQTSFRLPIALGVAGIIVLTGTDLSAGRIVGLVAMISLILLGGANAQTEIIFDWTTNMPWIWILVVLVIGMIVGGLVGAFNGFFVAKFSIHPFIVTLATQLIIYGVMQLITSPEVFNSSTTNLPYEGIAGSYRDFISGGFNLFGVKISWYILYAIILTAICWFIWNKTKIGKNMFAVGCNPESATVSGISVFKTILITFIMAGVLYSFTGFEVNPVLGGASVDIGTNYELDAITAAVIGGVSFTGGIGKISGVVIGAIFLQLITAGLQTIGVNASYIYIIKGAVILLAVSLDMKKYIAKK